ncbi:hypothetical protein F01_440118 [Burkholderia cenocepacia]|nr:hypothetical protein F01_440118 [Burkholderia cenocepacia]
MRRDAPACVRPCAARGRQALDRIPDQRLLGVRESGLTRARRLACRRACRAPRATQQPSVRRTLPGVRRGRSRAVSVSPNPQEPRRHRQ